ncbi:probable inactive leucine-rich repeat receptor-like protein kinase At1g66830 [Neltuma alba]|uniref:probable inactive leucine-rich repeat receptor-like protein kinase At1g66830 n=1 Tax=Neltuma alba TaxID=207710 RepID=UPI0010A353C7|nr:probable inactive leucine-rich repeat receptor-like protein kinase At1g66830 [Prosopis alba]
MWGFRNRINHFSNPCNDEGICCNDFGRVIRMNRPRITPQHPRLADLNLTVFSNLEDLALEGMGLIGNIPTQIGALHSLISLDLSNNNLIALWVCYLPPLPNLSSIARFGWKQNSQSHSLNFGFYGKSPRLIYVLKFIHCRKHFAKG